MRSAGRQRHWGVDLARPSAACASLMQNRKAVLLWYKKSEVAAQRRQRVLDVRPLACALRRTNLIYPQRVSRVKDSNEAPPQTDQSFRVVGCACTHWAVWTGASLESLGSAARNLARFCGFTLQA